MNFQHKNLSKGGWFKLTLIEQLSNVGSEIFRAINWKNKKNKKYEKLAFERALELLDLCMADKKNFSRLKEIARVREFLVDFFNGENIYNSSGESFQKYFFNFNYAARNNR